MKYLSLSLILVFAISIFSAKSDRHDLGSEYQAKYHSSLVLFHYKKDVIKVILTKDLIVSFDDLLLFSSVDARDLYKNPRLVFCHKHWLKILIGVNVVSYLISPYFWLAFCAVPFVFAKIGFGLLNTVGHKTPNGANVPWLNFFIAGEGYHRNHHTNMKRIRLHKWDIGGWIAEKLFLDYGKKSEGIIKR